jgi:outer membrane protein assembly factor BamE (lipoprotein component of BamABCDE complex)
MIVSLAAAVLTQACSSALHPRLTLAGRAVEWSRLDQVEVGTLESAVLEALGPPAGTTEDGGEVVWTYYERAQLRGCTSSVLFIPTGAPAVVDLTATVLFRDGVVMRVSRSERRVKGNAPEP